MLVVAVMGVVGGMEVIDSEAIGDTPRMRELSSQLASASGFELPTPVTSSRQASEGARLSGLTSPVIVVPPAPEQVVEQKQPGAEDTSQAAGSEAGDGASVDSIAEGASEDGDNAACPPVSAGAPYCIYVVKDGDTLSAIAVELGITSTAAFSGAELVALSNGLNDAQNWLIVPGQELRIPIASGVIHTVSESDTVSVLAESYGITTSELIAANNFADPNNIPVGEAIIVPQPNLWPWTGPVATAGDTAPEETALLATSEPEDPTATTEAATSEPEDASAPADTETPEPVRAAAVQSPTSANANPSVGSVRDQFAAGYIAGGGPAQYLEHILATVIPCESGYNVRAYNPAGPFYGLMQFLGETWARTGGGDWFDAWQQGHNTAVLLKGATPSSQWPHCWRGG